MVTPPARYRDREHAGQVLAEALEPYKTAHPLILGIPRGGVEVAYPLFLALGGDLDLLLVQKIGAPGNPEYALGALSETGALYLHEGAEQVPRTYLEETIEAAKEALKQKRALLGGDLPPIPRHGRTVILVDDGIATGSTLRAALQTLKEERPQQVIVAAPVAPPDTVARLRPYAHEVIVPLQPEPFFAVGEFYLAFPPTPTERVRELLSRARKKTPSQ